MSSPPPRPDRQQVLDWVAGFEETAKLERAEKRRVGPRPEWAVEAALQLIDFYGSLHGWPPALDRSGVRRRNETEEQWARLKAGLEVR